MRLARHLIALPRIYKRLVSIAIDIVGLSFVAVLAIWLRFGDAVFPITAYVPSIVLLLVIALPVFITQGLYRAVIRYIGYRFAMTVVYSVSLVTVLWAAMIFLVDLKYPRSSIIITWLLALFYISATRLGARWLLGEVLQRKRKNCRQVVIFGAGASGRQLLNAIEKMPLYKVVGFVDDDPNVAKHEINSVKVYRRGDFEDLVNNYGVSEVFLALPNLGARARKSLLEWLEPFPLKVSTLPGLDEIVEGKVSFSDVREIDVEDLLGRDPVPPCPQLLEQCVTGRAVMITGAGGTIGSELCRQVLKLKPKTIVLYELCEWALYRVDQDLSLLQLGQHVRVVSILGNVLDQHHVSQVMSQFAVDTVYHAAAYKHVPIVEHNIAAGINNNTFGTHVLARAAAECGVKNFVLVSTDKAVRPTNVMGGSKRLAEMVLQALQVEFPLTRFVMVRFGNVLGSSGSVIPLFRKQIEQGGPVTVTHKEITRYFMTISEAASLVIQAGSLGAGGEVFVLDMGEPVKIDDLARKLIKLSGFDVVDADGHGDIEVSYTGLRPGEKLYEELLIGENVDGTSHPKIMMSNEDFLSYEELSAELIQLEAFIQARDYQAVLAQLKKLVSGFKHSSGVVDYLVKPDRVPFSSDNA